MEYEDALSPEEKKKFRTTVRFSRGEYSQLENDTGVIGKTIPELLKEAYFVGPALTPLMKHDDLKMLMAQLGRIGNNINQIARKVNSGFREGFNDDIVAVRSAFTSLLVFLTSTYGRQAK
jgi:hypothetical protein